jgi:hypothetical protein
MSLIYSFLLFFTVFLSFQLDGNYILILDPSTASRQLADSFTKGLTLQFAEQIKQQLEAEYDIDVVITRAVGLHTSHENHAQLSNRLNANLYLHISFFQETSVKLQWLIYYHCVGNEYGMQRDTAFCTNQSAHTQMHTHSIKRAHTMHTTLQKLYPIFSYMPPVGMPCTLLSGIVAPALMLDIGLHAADDWHACIEPLCHVIGMFIAESV